MLGSPEVVVDDSVSKSWIVGIFVRNCRRDRQDIASLEALGGFYLTQRKHKMARGLLFDRESPQQRADFVCNPIGRFVV